MILTWPSFLQILCPTAHPFLTDRPGKCIKYLTDCNVKNNNRELTDDYEYVKMLLTYKAIPEASLCLFWVFSWNKDIMVKGGFRENMVQASLDPALKSLFKYRIVIETYCCILGNIMIHISWLCSDCIFESNMPLFL